MTNGFTNGTHFLLEREKELCYQDFLIGRDTLTDYFYDFDGKKVRLTIEVVSKVLKKTK